MEASHLRQRSNIGRSCGCLGAPVVEDAMDNHPLWFDAVAVEALLHHGVLGVDALPLLAVELLLTRTVVVGRRFVHVVFALVVAVHDGVIELQLWSHTKFSWSLGRSQKAASERTMLLHMVLVWTHLEFADPGAVPVGQAGPFHKELPLRSALQWCFGQRVVGLPIGACRQLRRQWGLSPGPVQDLLDLAFQRRTLANTNRTIGAGTGRD